MHQKHGKDCSRARISVEVGDADGRMDDGWKKMHQCIKRASSQRQEGQNVTSLSARAAGEVQGDRGDSPTYGNAHNIFVNPLGSGQVLRGT